MPEQMVATLPVPSIINSTPRKTPRAAPSVGDQQICPEVSKRFRVFALRLICRKDALACTGGRTREAMVNQIVRVFFQNRDFSFYQPAS